MAFNTLHFWYFFAIVYAGYRLLPHRWQNLWLLAAGYTFYAFWNWRFLPLLIGITVVNGWAASAIHREHEAGPRRRWLTAVILADVVIFIAFKQTGAAAVFGKMFSTAWSSGGVFALAMPLGLSFYLLQAMSYPIDVFRRRLSPAQHWTEWALCVNFFPCLIAGPITKTRDLLPQIEHPRKVTFGDVQDAVGLCGFGLFKKLVIADNLAKVTAVLFYRPSVMGTLELWIGVYLFTFQVYADFSGYSDIARGLGRAMGFNLARNFRVPFFSASPAEFWQRWHASLIEWVREYVFYPLGLLRWQGGGHLPTALVVLLTWMVMGFWHGVATVFLIWGFYHAVILLAWRRLDIDGRRLPRMLLKLLVFHLFAVGLVCFAVRSASQLADVWIGLFWLHRGTVPINFSVISLAGWLAAALLLYDYHQHRRQSDELAFFAWHPAARTAAYVVVFYLIVCLGAFSAESFFYFQF